MLVTINSRCTPAPTPSVPLPRFLFSVRSSTATRPSLCDSSASEQTRRKAQNLLLSVHNRYKRANYKVADSSQDPTGKSMSRVCRMQEHAQQKQQRQQQQKSVTLTAAVFFATLLFCSRPSVVQVSSFVVTTGAPPPRNSDYYSSRDSSSKRININAIQTAATPRATSPKLRALALPVAPKGKREAACASPTTHDEDTGEASVLPVPPSPQPLRDNAFSIRGIFGRCALPVLFRRVCIGSMALARGQGRLGAQGSPESSHRRWVQRSSLKNNCLVHSVVVMQPLAFWIFLTRVACVHSRV